MSHKRNLSEIVTGDIEIVTGDKTRVAVLSDSWWVPTIFYTLFELSKPGRHKRVVAVDVGGARAVLAMADALGVRLQQLSRTRYLNYILPDDSAAFALELPAHFLSTAVDDAFSGRNLSITVETKS